MLSISSQLHVLGVRDEPLMGMLTEDQQKKNPSDLCHVPYQRDVRENERRASSIEHFCHFRHPADNDHRDYRQIWKQ